MRPAAPLIALAMLALATPALAQAPAQTPAPAPEKPAAKSGSHTPIGRWRFETGMVTTNCKLSGDMQVSKASKSGLYSCTFVAVQSCTGKPPMEFQVQQTCVATQTGSQVTITSKIDKFVSVKPADMLAVVKSGYAADNFEVTLNTAGTEMRGLFHSLNKAAVRFWRPNSDLVS
jgi:hypothetical protein